MAGSNAAMPTLVGILIIGGVIYAFGYARAVMHRANSDYKKTKAGLPGMRKDFWRSWWQAVKIGFWIFVAGFALVSWVVVEGRG